MAASRSKKFIRRLRARCELPAILLARFLITRLSRPALLRLARALGDFGWRCAGRRSRVAAANLEIIFGPRLTPRRRQALTRAYFRHTARVLLDILWFSHDGRQRIATWVTLDRNLDNWLAAQKGAIIVTGHLGNWETAGQLVASHGYQLTSVAKPIGTPSTTRRLNSFRRALGQKIVMTDGAVRGMLRALQQGEFVALLLDQHVPPAQGGLWIDLFGLKATISGAAARLALKLKLPIAVCFAQALPDGRYRGRLIGLCAPATCHDDPLLLSQQIADHLASAIYRFPSQWLIGYRRWKRYPPGSDPSRYPFYAKPEPADPEPDYR